MKLLLVSDAWAPQTNGVVRTLEETTRQLMALGHMVRVVGPEATLFSFAAPTYPEIRLEFFAQGRLQAILDDFNPDYIHIATEGPLGLAMRRLCLTQRRPFSTAYHTCFPEYIEKRLPDFLSALGPSVRLLVYQYIKLFHAPSGAVMVATPSIEALLRQRRVKRIRRWSRGVDTTLFYPRDKDIFKDLPRPVFLYVGRIAVEKNLEAFLKADLPGSKVLIGDGPHEAEFRQHFPTAHFLGKKKGEELAKHYAAADVFVFPSKTDTFGLVLLEALASGLAIAAYPVQGPTDVFADRKASQPYVVLEDDLESACRKAAELRFDPMDAHNYVASTYSWENCTQQFLSNLQAATPFAMRRVSRFRWTLNLLDVWWRRLRTLPKFFPAVYRALTTFATPFLPAYLDWRVGKGKEDAVRLPERFGKTNVPRPSGKLVWCHAASVGESLSALPLIDKLRALPQAPNVLITSGTRMAAEILAKRLPQGVIHQYAPIDTVRAQTRFMRHWRPDLALVIESELWPNMIGRIRRFGVPAAMVNARMSKSSADTWSRWAGLWIARMLGVFDMVIAQSAEDAERFRMLGAYNARSEGNLKAAAPPPPVNEADLQKLRAAIAGRPVWLMASTHPGEDEIAIQAHRLVAEKIPGLLTIIAPRHPGRSADIQNLCANNQLPATRRSKGELPEADTAIYIADTSGEMGTLYSAVGITCMCGSFLDLGGHNPLEPAHFGNAILFGPDMRNAREMADGLLAGNAAIALTNGAALGPALAELFSHTEKAAALAQNAKNFAAAQKHILDRVMLALHPLLQRAL